MPQAAMDQPAVDDGYDSLMAALEGGGAASQPPAPPAPSDDGYESLLTKMGETGHLTRTDSVVGGQSEPATYMGGQWFSPSGGTSNPDSIVDRRTGRTLKRGEAGYDDAMGLVRIDQQRRAAGPQPRPPVNTPQDLWQTVKDATSEPGAAGKFVGGAYDSSVGAAVRGVMRGTASVKELAGGDGSTLRGAANVMAGDAGQNETSAAGQLGGIAGQSVPAAVAMAATKGRVGAVPAAIAQTAAFGTLGLGSAEQGMADYENAMAARGEPISPGKQLAIGGAYAAAEVIFEKVGIDAAGHFAEKAGGQMVDAILHRNVAALSKVLMNVGMAGATNATEEGVTQIAQNIIDRVGYDPERDLTEGVEGSAFQGGLQGLALGGGGAGFHAAGRVVEGRQRAARLSELQGRRQFNEAGRAITAEMRTTPVTAQDQATGPSETPGQTAVRNALAWGDTASRTQAIQMRAAELATQRENAAREADRQAAEQARLEEATKPAPAPEAPPAATPATTEGGTPLTLTREEAKAGGWDQGSHRSMVGRFDDVYAIVSDANAAKGDKREYALVKAPLNQFGIVSRLRGEAANDTQQTAPPPAAVAAPVQPTQNGVVVPAANAGAATGVSFDAADDDATIRGKYEQHQRLRSKDPSITVALLKSSGNPTVDAITKTVARFGGRAVVVRSSKPAAVRGLSIRGGTMVIDMAGTNAVSGLIAHETLHRLQHLSESGDTGAGQVLDGIRKALGVDGIARGLSKYQEARASRGLPPVEGAQATREGQAMALEALVSGPPGAGVRERAVHRLLRDRFRDGGEPFAARVKTLLAKALNRMGLLDKATHKGVLDAVDAWSRYAKNAQAATIANGTEQAGESRADGVADQHGTGVAARGVGNNGHPGAEGEGAAEPVVKVAGAEAIRSRVDKVETVDAAHVALTQSYGAWIAPDGVIYDVPYQRHWEVAKKLGKQYGIKESTNSHLSSEDRWRVPALGAGFVRVVRAGRRVIMQTRGLTPQNIGPVMDIAKMVNRAGNEFLLDDIKSGETVMSRLGESPSNLASRLRSMVAEPDEALSEAPHDERLTAARLARNGGPISRLARDFGADESVSKNLDANDDVRSVAETYMAKAGIGNPLPKGVYAPWDTERAKRIADAYDAGKSDPGNPAVAKAYAALAAETKAQFDHATKAGFRFVPWAGEGQPYLDSDAMRRDVRENKRLFYFKTITEGLSSFGTGNSGEGDNPLLADAGRPVADSAGKTYKQTYNDLFRAVHDFFGHAKEGYQFGPRGEENAWMVHSAMFTDTARQAMTTETRGQNSWVNAGRHLRNADGSLPAKGEKGFVAPEARRYADQKVMLLPKEFSGVDEAVRVKYRPDDSPAFKRWFAGSKVVDEDGRPMALYHGTTQDFRAFSREKASPEGDWGRGFYFSNTPEEVSANYAGIGPDMKVKIEALQERYENQAVTDLIDAGQPVPDRGTAGYARIAIDAKRRAKAELVGHGGAGMKVYVSMKNPLVVDGEGDAWLGAEYEYENPNDPDSDIKGVTGPAVKLLQAVEERGLPFDLQGLSVQELVESVAGDGGAWASDLMKTLKDGEYLSVYDDEGRHVGSEVLRAAIEDAGYDGIIDNTVDKRFGSQSKLMARGGMDGMHPGTTHYIAFRPEQIKSATGNRGTFSAKSPNIDEGLAHPEELANKIIAAAVGRVVAQPTVTLLKRLTKTLAAGKAGPAIDAMRGAVRRVGLEVVPDRLLVPEWVAARNEAELGSRFGKALGAAYGTLLHYGGESKALGFEIDKKWVRDPANRRLMNDALLGDKPMSALPAEYQPVVTKVRDEMDALGQRMVNAGYMSQETYDVHKGKYLPRLYTERELEKRGLRGAVNRLRMNNERRQPRLSDAFAIVDSKGNPIDGPSGSFRFASALDRDQYLDGLIQTNTVADVNRAIRGSGQSISIADLAPINLGRLSQPLQQLVKSTRSDVAARYAKNDPKTDAELDAMGLIREPAYPVATAMIQLRHDLSMLKFYGHMAANASVSSDTETAYFNRQVPAGPKYGALAGRWLPEELHRDLANLNHAPGIALEFYRTALNAWKFGKTVLSPATWGRNFLGNFQFADLAGIGLHDPRAWRHYVTGVMNLAGKNGPGIVQEMQRVGVIGTEFNVTELGRVLDELGATLNTKPSPLVWMWQLLKGGMGRAADGYGVIDALFKAASYAQQRDMGLTPKDAADHVRKWFPDYSRVPKTSTVRGIRDVVFPFFSFYYEALRINALAAKEKPLTLAKWASVPWLVTQMSYGLLGAGGDDKEKIREELKGGGLFSMLLPFRDSKGRLLQWDLSNVIPTAGVTGLKAEASPLEDKTFAENLLGGLITSNPLSNLAVTFGTNRDPFTKRAVFQSGMTPMENVGAAANVIRRTAQPGIVNAAETNINATKTQRSTLDKRDQATTAIRSVAGIDVRSADPMPRRMIEEFLQRHKRPVGSDPSGDSTPRQRAVNELYQALLDNDQRAFNRAIVGLDEAGAPVKSFKEVEASIKSRHPLARIRTEDRPTFMRELTPEQRRVIETATKEYNALIPRALRLYGARSLP